MKRVVLIACALLLGGCGSPWKENYAGVKPGVVAPAAAVEIREVPWSRVDAQLRTIEADRAGSDTHISEWPPERREAEKASLLRGLQVSESPVRVRVLGRSVFRSTDPIRPGDGRLERFAKRIGADLVVFSAGFVGKGQRIIREPVTNTGFGWGSYRDRDGAYHDRYRPYTETVMVPVAVEADEYAWVVFYLRRE